MLYLDQQDNRSLEDHLEVSRQIRDELEGQLEQSRKVREELQSKVKEEDAKAVFLHFTQEQLNSQVVSLEEIVKNLKVENQLLNKAIQKLVVCVNEEKDKLAEEKEKLEEVESSMQYVSMMNMSTSFNSGDCPVQFRECRF